jgi:CubicO group peptidase (beta-lactamase class C family)
MTLDIIIQLLTKEHESLEAYLEANRTYGLSIAVIDDDQVPSTLATGLRQPIDESTMFQAASMSKTIFAATVMRLAEIGRLDIDKNIATEIGEILPFVSPDLEITFADLLNHTAGFNVHGFSGYLHTQELPTLTQTLLGERPANSLKLALIHPPKTTFVYSGGGYQLAQYLLEKITKKAYVDWAKELIFDPLAMKNSMFQLGGEGDGKKRIAQAWTAHDTPVEQGYVIYPEAAAAGLWTTPTDLARFGMELMKAWHGISAWLSAKSAKRMTTPQTTFAPNYGLGCQLKSTTLGMLFGHRGDNIGFHGKMVFDPRTKRGIVVMVNSDIGDDIPNQVVQIYEQLAGGTKTV